MNKSIIHEILMLATANLPLKTISSSGQEYLRRYFVKQNEDGSQYWLHHFLRNDAERHLHSHPGTATSKILCGSYAEELENGVRYYSTGETNTITAGKLHRIIQVEPDTWTLMHVMPDWLESDSWYFIDYNGVKTEVKREPGADWWAGLPVRCSQPLKLRSKDCFDIPGRGRVFVVESPVSAERNFESLLSAIGKTVEIDGTLYKTCRFETHMLGTAVEIGEMIGIFVKPLTKEQIDFQRWAD